MKDKREVWPQVPGERRKTMHSETDQSDESRQQENPSESRTVEQKKLDRLANEAAERAERTEQRFDRDHDIFIK
jgi:hypothetical protein